MPDREQDFDVSGFRPGAAELWRKVRSKKMLWVGMLSALAPAWKKVLWVIERAGDLDFLISFYQRFYSEGRALWMAHWDIFLMVLGFLLIALSIRQGLKAVRLELGALKVSEKFTKSNQGKTFFLPEGIRLEYQAVSLHGSLSRTTFVLVANEDLRGKAIRISCDGPIYEKAFSAQYIVGRAKYRMLHGSFSRPENEVQVIYKARTEKDIVELTVKEAEARGNQVERVPGPAQDGIEHESASVEDLRADDINSVIFDFSGKRFSARPFMRIVGEVSSLKPINVERVEWVKPLL